MANNVLYALTLEPFNYPLVFGCMFGIAVIVELESLVTTALTFVRGWRSS